MEHNTLFIVSASFSDSTAHRTAQMFNLRGVCISAKEAEELAERLGNEEEDLFQDFANAKRVGWSVSYLVEEINTADASGKPTIPVYIVTANFDNADGFRFEHYARFICGVKNTQKEAEELITMLEDDDDDHFQNREFASVLDYELEYQLSAIKTDHTGLVTSTYVPLEEDPNNCSLSRTDTVGCLI